ncbi:hypothetical protein M409DRAFT_66675 [Zasmidium cellare ATCC 36951]|uniref:Cercosporin MFS transporter CTB4 n=1 Tax=Zasmidium cellare ATCC 36951 TaxID=1080233 RepID=A0A6A6CGH6_ZASCE|nr:uncharacterized protein M409DRAFT_66675 [Zasmidium cellare ATCC 36951]KAF2166161.1 hypothetical protein M409DRAFT_66675 [Zasmidium cellare ATCC 36951]
MEKFLARLEPSDDPKHFNSWYKGWICLQMALLSLTASIGSSIISPAETVLSAYLGISLEAAVLTVSLFVLGFALGPICWGPISEVYGRRWSLLPPMFLVGVFSIASAVSKDTASLLVTRFFAGVFGSSPIANVSAALGDFYEPKARGVPMAFLAACVVGGALIAPIMGAGLTVNKHLGWRWTEFLEAIIAFLTFAVTFAFMPETYPPVLLKRKAKQLRKSTGEQRYWHPHEQQKISVQNVLTKHFNRPILMLLTEPMVSCMALYASFVYGLLFFALESFPIVFAELRHWELVPSTLPFLGLFVGVIIAICINIGNQPRYMRAVEKNQGRAVPEARLAPMVIGGFCFSGGLFWFGWTASPSIPWIVPVIASAFIGAGFNIIFQQALNFLVDAYSLYAASALSANAILRSAMACGLPLAARPLFENLGVGPGASVLGGISCLALPIPFLFMKYTTVLRSKSKFAPSEE